MDTLSLILIVIGALNWGLVGIFQFDLVAAIFGGMSGVVFHDITRTLYSVLPLYVSALVMDGVIYGLDYSSLALIISDHYAEIVQTIADRLDRGATLLEAHGGYHGDSRQVVMCAIRRRQITELKDLVSEIDPHAFLILQDAHQVLGEGFRHHGDSL